MNWSDERYVRLYIRDTIDWLALPWESRALFPLMLRKADRAGVIVVGKHGARGLAGLVSLPPEVVTPGLAGLLADGCVVESDDRLCIPNFIEAQEAPMSDRLRQSESRHRRRYDALSRNVTPCHETAAFGHETRQLVTSGHEVSRDVTPCHSVLSRAVPCLPVPKEPLSPSVPADDRPVAYLELDPATDELHLEASPPPTQANLLTVAPAAKPRTDVDDVWAHYRDTVSPRSQITPARRALIAKWLAPKGPYTADDLKRTIDGYRASPHHNGQNDRGEKYLSLELFLRDAGHIEAGWRYLTPSKPTAPKPPSGFNAPPPSRPPPPLFVPKPLPDRTPESDAAREAHRPSFARHAPAAAPTEAQIAERAAAKRALLSQGEGGAA